MVSCLIVNSLFMELLNKSWFAKMMHFYLEIKNYVLSEFLITWKSVYGIILSEENRLKTCSYIMISTTLKCIKKSERKYMKISGSHWILFVHLCIFSVFSIVQTFYNTLITLRINI